MAQEINIIDLGGVNCYLVKTGSGYILIDTGFANKRAVLETALAQAGCRPGNLSLVILTHGDADHSENAAFLQATYGAKIAIHADDAGMVERGDFACNRQPQPAKIAFSFRVILWVSSHFMSSSQFEVLTPDLLIGEDFKLADYGFGAQVVRLPGHSKGSLGILTAAGDLVCGDLLYHLWGKPTCLFIDDQAAYDASLKKVQQLPVRMIYPGHGKSFPPAAVFGK